MHAQIIISFLIAICNCLRAEEFSQKREIADVIERTTSVWRDIERQRSVYHALYEIEKSMASLTAFFTFDEIRDSFLARGFRCKEPQIFVEGAREIEILVSPFARYGGLQFAISVKLTRAGADKPILITPSAELIAMRGSKLSSLVATYRDKSDLLGNAVNLADSLSRIKKPAVVYSVSITSSTWGSGPGMSSFSTFDIEVAVYSASKYPGVFYRVRCYGVSALHECVTIDGKREGPLLNGHLLRADESLIGIRPTGKDRHGGLIWMESPLAEDARNEKQ